LEGTSVEDFGGGEVSERTEVEDFEVHHSM
jgi:hypothetical protein